MSPANENLHDAAGCAQWVVDRLRDALKDSCGAIESAYILELIADAAALRDRISAAVEVST